MVAFESCYSIDLYGCCRIDAHLAQLLFYLYKIIVSFLLAMFSGIGMHRFIWVIAAPFFQMVISTFSSL